MLRQGKRKAQMNSPSLLFLHLLWWGTEIFCDQYGRLSRRIDRSEWVQCNLPNAPVIIPKTDWIAPTSTIGLLITIQQLRIKREGLCFARIGYCHHVIAGGQWQDIKRVYGHFYFLRWKFMIAVMAYPVLEMKRLYSSDIYGLKRACFTLWGTCFEVHLQGLCLNT